MTSIPEPAFEPVRYAVQQKRLSRLARTGMRRSFSRDFWFMWGWLALYMGLLVTMAVYPRPLEQVARTFGRSIGWRTDSVMALLFGLVMVIFVAGFVVLRRRFSRSIAQRVNFGSTLEFYTHDRGVAILGPHIDYHLRWPGIHQLLIEPDGLVLAHGGLFFFVPANAFASPKHYQDVVAHISANLTPEAAALSQKDIARAQAEK